MENNNKNTNESFWLYTPNEEEYDTAFEVVGKAKENMRLLLENYEFVYRKHFNDEKDYITPADRKDLVFYLYLLRKEVDAALEANIDLLLVDLAEMDKKDPLGSQIFTVLQMYYDYDTDALEKNRARKNRRYKKPNRRKGD